MTRRPTRLEQPPPGSRCPACWHGFELRRFTVSICPCCFVMLACLAPGRLQRLAPADLTRLSALERDKLERDREQRISAAAGSWRALPRTPRPPLRL